MKPTEQQLMQLWHICSEFIQDNHVSCPEATINDRVYENAPELVEKIGNLVGYFEWEDE